MLKALRNLFSRPRKPAIEVELMPATGEGSAHIEAWVFPLDPSADPSRFYLNRTSPLIEAAWITEYSAYFQDRWAAETLGILTPGGRSNPPPAWDTETAVKEAQQFLATAPEGSDMWVLEHTSTAPGVRAHHATGTIELPFAVPANVDTRGPMHAARQWLMEHKRSFLESRPPEHCLRKALPEGPEAVMQALQTIDWSPREVEHARSALIYMARPPCNFSDPEVYKLWTSHRSEQESWLRKSGHYSEEWTAGPDTWVPNEAFQSTFLAICKAIPEEFATPEFFQRTVRHISIVRMPLFWLAFHTPEQFWDQRTTFWEQLGGIWKSEKQRAKGITSRGLITLTEPLYPRWGHLWALEVFAQLPPAKQWEALDEALEDMVCMAEQEPYSKSGNAHLLQPLAPDWPHWDLVKEGLEKPLTFRSRYREQQLQESLPEVDGILKKQRF